MSIMCCLICVCHTCIWWCLTFYCHSSGTAEAPFLLLIPLHHLNSITVWVTVQCRAMCVHVHHWPRNSVRKRLTTAFLGITGWYQSGGISHLSEVPLTKGGVGHTGGLEGGGRLPGAREAVTCILTQGQCCLHSGCVQRFCILTCLAERYRVREWRTDLTLKYFFP